MHLDTTMELAAIRQREIQHGEFRRTAGRRASGHRLFARHARHARRTTGTGGA